MTADTRPLSQVSSDRWENEGGPARPPEMAKTENEQSAELKRYGITPVQLTVFDWGGYRYSSAADAVAAAKRAATSGGGNVAHSAPAS